MTTEKSITENQIRALQNEASDAGDDVQVAICVVALDGSIDLDDYAALSLSASDRKRVRAMSREEAIRACVEALNSAAAMAD